MEDKISILKFLLSIHPLFLPRVLNSWEKRVIIFLLIIIVVGSGIVYRQNYLDNTKEIPADGGTYSEGLLTDSANTLTEVITALTHIGLTQLGEDGSIQPALAKSWQISEDGKTYNFTLQKGQSSYDIAPYIRQQKGSWSEVNVVTPDKQTIQFVLKQPYGLFLASTLRPIFPHGPYKINKQDNKEIILVANTQSPLPPPHLKQITLRLYSDPSTLLADLRRGSIIGTGENIEEPGQHFTKHSFNLPRYTVAFFNTGKSPLSDKKVREQLVNGPAFTQPVNLTLLRANTEPARLFSESLQAKWKDRNIKINEKVKDNVTLLSEEVAKKNYDILIYGLNTGYYDDLYPYWHSSQQLPNGMNFSGVANKPMDKLLEEARLTLDDKVRREKFTQVRGIIQAEYLGIFEDPSPYTFYTHSNIKGIKQKFGVTPTDRFTFTKNWYIKTRRVSNK